MLGGLIEAGGSLLAGGLNYAGQHEANRMNRKIAREQMSFQQASNREQMAFQERMSNTSYQRAVADMEAAGINPMLAAMSGGASSPGGASSSGASAHMENEFGAGLRGSIAMRQASANVAQVKALTKLMEAELPGKEAEAALYKSQFGKFVKVLQALNPLAHSAASLIKSGVFKKLPF